MSDGDRHERSQPKGWAMDLIVSLLSYALCIVFYIRMYARETPEPMERKAAVLPVALGMVTPFLSTVMVMLAGLLVLNVFGKPLSDLIPTLTLKSLVSSFLTAGLAEELSKFLVYLLVVRLVKPKNVYEHGVLCAGVGVGFTALEELLYGSGNIVVSLIRLPVFAMHMALGIIMGTNLGRARYAQQEGDANANLYLILGLAVPVLWHTVYDAATVMNAGFAVEDEAVVVMAITVSLAVVLVSAVFQFLVLNRFKGERGEYCSLELHE